MSNTIDMLQAMLDKMREQDARLNALDARINALDTRKTSETRKTSKTSETRKTSKTSETRKTSKTSETRKRQHRPMTAAEKKTAAGVKGATMRRLNAAGVTANIVVDGTWLWLTTDSKLHAADLPTGWHFASSRKQWYRVIANQ